MKRTSVAATGIAFILAGAVLALGSTSQARTTAQPVYAPPQQYYLALGDSIAYGFQAAKVGSPARHGEELPESYEAYKIFSTLSGMTEGSSDEFVDLLLNQVAIAGDPGEVTERLTALHEAGYPSVICWMNFGGIAHEDSVASMRRFADEVAPKLPR